MKRLIWLMLILMACVQPPAPPTTRVFKTLGSLEVSLDINGEAKAKLIKSVLRPQNSTPLPDNAFVFTRKYSSSFDIDASNERYISATFEVKNNSGTAIQNLSLVAYNQGGNSLGGTAIKNLVNFGGAAITDSSIAQSIYPLQGVKRNGAEVVVDPDSADFQGFSPEESSSIGSSARSNQIINNQDTALEYGFVARNSNNSRTIGDGETGLVTLTLRFERPSNPQTTPYRFVMTFVLSDDSLARVTRGINETTTEAETRAYTTGATELMLIGPDADTSSNTNIQTNRLENARIGLEPSYLVKPSLFMRDLQPSSIKNDSDNTVLIRGTKFDASTSFFIQSTKLDILSLTPNQAQVVIPKGFIPSKYGIMAANNTGKHATLYPAITIKAGTPARDLDIRENYQSFIDGYVFDYQSKALIKNAKISIPGLETTSSETGYFLLRGVPAGRQVVKIQKQDYGYNPETGQYGQVDTHEPLYRIANVPNNPNSTITLKLVMLEPKVNNSTIIGSSGGIHYASSNHSTGAFIKIPAGALSKDTPIQFTHLRDGTTLPELNDNGNYLAFAHLGPTGLVFKKPATLFLPLQNGIVLNVNETINIGYFDSIRGEWIDDITSGKISKINGQLYLEYEINHFTWIGGFNPLPSVPFTGSTGGCNMSPPPPPINYDPKNPPEVPTCDKKPESDDRKPGCSPRAGIPTDQGISDEDGNVTGSKPGSRATQTITINPLGYGDNVIPARSDPIEPDNSTPQRLPCARIPSPNEPYKAAPKPVGDNPCGTPAVRPFSSNPSPSTQGARPQATTGNLLLVSSNLHGFTTSLGNFSGAKIDPSSLKLKMGSLDVTSVTEIKPSSSIYDGFDFTVTLKEPLKAQVGLEVRLEGKTLDGKVVDSRVGVDVVAGFTSPPLMIYTAPDSAFEENETTPVIVASTLSTQVLYRRSDLENSQFLDVPVFAIPTDETQEIMTGLTMERPISLNFEFNDFSVTSNQSRIIQGVYRSTVRVPTSQINGLITKSISMSLSPSLVANGLRLQGLNDFICKVANQPLRAAVIISVSAGEGDALGLELMEQYLTGRRLTFRKFNDPKWSTYLMQHPVLQNDLDNEIRRLALSYINLSVGVHGFFVNNKLPNGIALCDGQDSSVILNGRRCKLTTGYGLLNGSNDNYGGMAYEGSLRIDVYPDGSRLVTAAFCYTFNDLGDFESKKYPLFDGTADLITQLNLATGVGGPYRVSIGWCTTAIYRITPNGIFIPFSGYPAIFNDFTLR